MLWSIECKRCASDLNMLVAIHDVLKVKCSECGCTETNKVFKENVVVSS